MTEPGAPRVAVYLDFDNIVISRYDQIHGRNSFQRDKAGGLPQDAGAADHGDRRRRRHHRLRVVVRHPGADAGLRRLVGRRQRRLPGPAGRPRRRPGAAVPRRRVRARTAPTSGWRSTRSRTCDSSAALDRRPPATCVVRVVPPPDDDRPRKTSSPTLGKRSPSTPARSRSHLAGCPETRPRGAARTPNVRRDTQSLEMVARSALVAACLRTGTEHPFARPDRLSRSRMLRSGTSSSRRPTHLPGACLGRVCPSRR